MPSTVIRHFAYDAPSASLDVEFVSGRLYRYRGVPADLVQQFRTAASKGRFFNRHIRDNFRFMELDVDAASDPWAA